MICMNKLGNKRLSELRCYIPIQHDTFEFVYYRHWYIIFPQYANHVVYNYLRVSTKLMESA